MHTLLLLRVAQWSVKLGQFYMGINWVFLHTPSLCRWEEFTDAVVRVLSKKQHIVYLLWGKPAQLKYVPPLVCWCW